MKLESTGGMLGVAAVAALVGAGFYLALQTDGPSTRGAASGPVAPVSISPGGSAEMATVPDVKADTRAFAFADPIADADDISEVRFVDGDGRRLALTDFRGRKVLLNVWATWCGPCREEMPTLDRLQARLGSEDFEVVALSIDFGGVPVVREFYEELGLQSLRLYVDPSGRATINLKVLGIPSTLVIDHEGRELGRYVGPTEWDSEPVVEAIEAILSRTETRSGSTADTNNPSAKKR